MPRAKQLTVWVEDRPGILGEVASALAARGINIIAFFGGKANGRGIVQVVVDKPATAVKVFAQKGWKATEEDIVQVALRDEPGALAEAATRLGEAGINIRYAYTGPSKIRTEINTYFVVTDVAAALKALRHARPR